MGEAIILIFLFICYLIIEAIIAVAPIVLAILGIALYGLIIVIKWAINPKTRPKVISGLICTIIGIICAIIISVGIVYLLFKNNPEKYGVDLALIFNEFPQYFVK